jgi:DNA replication protein DnaC
LIISASLIAFFISTPGRNRIFLDVIVSAETSTKLKLAKVDGTYITELKKLQKINLLILDDFGLQAFDNHAREALMDIIDDRFNQKSTIVSSQIPVSACYDTIGEVSIKPMPF